MSKLSMIAKDDNSYCCKIVNSTIYRCKECEQGNTVDNLLICDECYDNTKHLGHVFEMKEIIDGYCDCGDSSMMSPEAFCFKHKGRFTTDEQVNEYVNRSFTEEQQISIRSVLLRLFTIMVSIITKAETEVHSLSKDILIKQFINFIGKICNVNHAMIHLMSEMFIRNYPYETTHQCFKVSHDSIEIDKDNIGTPHQCKCTFMQLLFNVYNPNELFTNIFLLFLRDPKLRGVMHLSIFASFESILRNNNNDIIFIINYQIADITILLSKFSPVILCNCFDVIYKLSKEILEKFQDLLLRRIQIINGISSLAQYIIQIIDKKTDGFEVNLNGKFYKRFIDIICLLQNCITLQEALKLNRKEKHLDVKDFILIEKSLLRMFSLMVSLIDFNNKILVKELFRYFIMKFNDTTSYRQLDKDEYTFHIPLYRAFSILLTKYTIHQVIEDDSTINNVIEIILNSKDLCFGFDFKPIILDIFKCLGFIQATRQLYWVDAGIIITAFNKYYYQYHTFHNCDLSLIKLLCISPEYSSLLSINIILQSANICNSYNTLSSFNSLTQSQKREYNQSYDISKELFYYNDIKYLYTELIGSSRFIVNIFLKSIGIFPLPNKSITTYLNKNNQQNLKSIIIYYLSNALLLKDNNFSRFFKINFFKSLLIKHESKQYNFEARIKEVICRRLYAKKFNIDPLKQFSECEINVLYENNQIIHYKKTHYEERKNIRDFFDEYANAMLPLDFEANLNKFYKKFDN